MKFKYPLAASTWDQSEIDAMQGVISSGMFTMGKNVLEFENKFAKYIGSNYAVMSNSGSSANLQTLLEKITFFKLFNFFQLQTFSFRCTSVLSGAHFGT